MTLSIDSITYRDNPQHAAAHYKLTLEAPEFVGLVGANGSGKSTFLKLLTGEYSPASGSIDYNGISIESQPSVFKQKLGYMPDKFATEPYFSVKQFLHFAAYCKCLSATKIDDHIDQLLTEFHLQQQAHSKINALSLGQQQKLNLAQALMAKPELLLLDEPLNGLDPVEQNNFWQLLEQYSPSYIFMASHNIQELQQRCHRIMVIHDHTFVANIDLTQTAFLLALSHPLEDSDGDTQHSQLLAFNSEADLIQSKAKHSQQTLCSGSTMTVLNELFHLQANGTWQW